MELNYLEDIVPPMSGWENVVSLILLMPTENEDNNVGAPHDAVPHYLESVLRIEGAFALGYRTQYALAAIFTSLLRWIGTARGAC